MKVFAVFEAVIPFGINIRLDSPLQVASADTFALRRTGSCTTTANSDVPPAENNIKLHLAGTPQEAPHGRVCWRRVESEHLLHVLPPSANPVYFVLLAFLHQADLSLQWHSVVVLLMELDGANRNKLILKLLVAKQM